MVFVAISFAAAILVFHQLPSLPSIWWVLAFIPVIFLYRWQGFLPLLAFIAGISISWWHGVSYLNAIIPEDLERQDFMIKGKIVDLPVKRDASIRLVLNVDQAWHNDKPFKLSGKVQLNWYQTELIPEAGDYWQLQARLFQPRGFSNFHGFDYEGLLYRRQIIAKGYVRDSTENKKLAEALFSINRLRGQTRDHLSAILKDYRSASVIKALLIGDKSGLNQSQWRLFRETGINHLIAISGLHIGLIALFAFLLVERLWRFAGVLPLYLPSPVAGAGAAILAAGAYALMAGLSIPTQRALVMTLVISIAAVLYRHTRITHSLAVALIIVLAMHPASILSAGLWLSFGAVLVIALVLKHFPDAGRLKQLVVIQLVLSLSLTPVLAWFGFPVSLIGPVVNLILVPLFSLLIPLLFASALVLLLNQELAALLLELLAMFLDGVLKVLNWLSDFLPLLTLPELAFWQFVIAVSGLFLFLRYLNARTLVICLISYMVLLLPKPADDFRMTVLDVGQGEAIVIEQPGQTLVYDLGPIFSSGFNTAEAVVIPHLQARGVDHIDRLILSHNDTDHTGGYRNLLNQFDVGYIYAGQPDTLEVEATQCVDQSWQYRDVSYRFIDTDVLSTKDNDFSCVLLIEINNKKILLNGDISHLIEKAIQQQHPEIRDVYISTVPHHGSRSSSSAGFIERLNANYALVSSRWKNSYGHPNADVIERWKDSHIFNTGVDGAIEFIWRDHEFHLQTARATDRRWWQRP